MEHVAQGSLQSSFLEISNARLDKVLSNWSDLLASPALSKGLDYTTSSALSKLFFSSYHFYKYSRSQQSAELLFKYSFVNNTPPPKQYL